MQQAEAFTLMKMGKNIFLTGAPGSGKTYLLNKYIAYLRNYDVKVAVTASTGIAATHLHGVTIHSWSGMGVRDNIGEKELEKMLTRGLIKRNYKNTKTLIIDEISMLHKHQLDMIDTISRYILEPDKPFGGLQVILCGDFFQLPPVSSSPLISEVQFAFEADTWKNGNFHVCYLEEQHRQGDDSLLDILKDIREGTIGEHTKIPLRTRYKKEPAGATKATKLYARNINVDDINEHELKNIHAEEKIFTMTTTGFSALVDGLKKGCLAQEQLKLKKGAEVMFVKNDTGGKYVNGTRGVVIGFDREEGWPLVKTYGNRIIVTYPEEWKYEDNGIVRATLTQVPLRLAWAITIHKSQGMTLDAAEMDLGDVFEPGMGYVALSRVRSLNGLKLMNLNELALKVHPKIFQHDKIFRDNSDVLVKYLRTLSEKEKEQYQRKTLIERFGGWVEEKINMREKEKRRKSKKLEETSSIPTHMITGEMLKKKLSIKLIAKKRGISVDTIINHIEKLQNLKQMDHADMTCLKKMISEIDFDIIFSELKKSEDGRLKPIYDRFEGKYSYTDIKIARLFINK
jgi:ATP-dependent exoDNAse (exonuclease V) alpha subunit